MRIEYQLTEAEIKEAIAAWLKVKGVDVKSVYITTTPEYDRMDRVTGQTVSAKASTA